METLKTDFLVIGSGIAGLTYALKTASALPEKHITIICKSEPKETNTKYAQGGIAISMKTAFDSPNKHIADTLKAGDGLCNKKVVEIVVKEGPGRLEELINTGVKFDLGRDGSFDLALEGGHSVNRIYHRRDYTGLEIERKLLAKVRKMENICIMDHATAIDLITDIHIPEKIKKNTCHGAFVLIEEKHKIIAVLSGITVLATGGIGQLFEHTTNSSIATGDGIAMAHRAHAKIKNMAFIQFHPTALFDKTASRDFLISEALRGFGATLRNIDGEAFMRNYDPAGDLATRDVVARAIKTEMVLSSSEFVYLDCTHIEKKDLVKHFPTILARCMTMGIDPSKNMIPVVPSAHFSCGGISTDLHGRTSLTNLYACGECAETGLHGANRLASNSLLEALVFAHRCFADSVKNIATAQRPESVKTPDVQFSTEQATFHLNDLAVTIKKIMSGSVGVITTDYIINEGINALKQLRMQITCQQNNKINSSRITINNMIDTAFLILQDSASRTHNAGAFYNTDRTVTGLKVLPVKPSTRTDKNPVPV